MKYLSENDILEAGDIAIFKRGGGYYTTVFNWAGKRAGQCECGGDVIWIHPETMEDIYELASAHPEMVAENLFYEHYSKCPELANLFAFAKMRKLKRWSS